MANSVIVVGGGMVGVSCALYLLKKQFNVILIEKNEVGNETSYGNAGVISTGSILPLNNAKLKNNIHKYALNKHPAMRYNSPYVFKNRNWVIDFLSHSSEESTLQRAQALDTLIKPALAEHKQLMAEADISHRLRESGWLKLFRSEVSFSGSSYEQGIYQQNDVAFEVVNRNQITDLEPGLNPIFEKGLWMTGSASVDNPGEVVKAYAKLFLQMGGVIVKDAVTSLEKKEQGFVVKACRQNYQADDVVLATGPWANQLLAPFRYQIPMVFERGYHQHFHSHSESPLQRPVYDVEGSYVMSPTDLGIRLSTGVELNEREGQPNHSQLSQAHVAAREAIDLAESCHSNVWVGSRPSLPDALPIIGQVPHTEGLWLACGHQHIGFSTGPITGKIMANMIARERNDIVASPFSAERFLLAG